MEPVIFLASLREGNQVAPYAPGGLGPCWLVLCWVGSFQMTISFSRVSGAGSETAIHTSGGVRKQTRNPRCGACPYHVRSHLFPFALRAFCPLCSAVCIPRGMSVSTDAHAWHNYSRLCAHVTCTYKYTHAHAAFLLCPLHTQADCHTQEQLLDQVRLNMPTRRTEKAAGNIIIVVLHYF